MDFQSRLNSFRQGLSDQQNNYDRLATNAAQFGRTVMPDKLAEHYQYMEQVGGLTTGSFAAAHGATKLYQRVKKARAAKRAKYNNQPEPEANQANQTSGRASQAKQAADEGEQRGFQDRTTEQRAETGQAADKDVEGLKVGEAANEPSAAAADAEGFAKGGKPSLVANQVDDGSDMPTAEDYAARAVGKRRATIPKETFEDESGAGPAEDLTPAAAEQLYAKSSPRQVPAAAPEPAPAAPASEAEGGILRKAGQSGAKKSVQFGGEAVEEGLGESSAGLTKGGVPYTKTSTTLNPIRSDAEMDLYKQEQARKFSQSAKQTPEQAEGVGKDFEALQQGKPRDPGSAAQDIYNRKQNLTPAQSDEFDARATAEGANHPDTGSYAHEDAIMSDIEERGAGPRASEAFTSMYDNPVMERAATTTPQQYLSKAVRSLNPEGQSEFKTQFTEATSDIPKGQGFLQRNTAGRDIYGRLKGQYKQEENTASSQPQAAGEATAQRPPAPAVEPTRPPPAQAAEPTQAAETFKPAQQGQTIGDEFNRRVGATQSEGELGQPRTTGGSVNPAKSDTSAPKTPGTAEAETNIDEAFAKRQSQAASEASDFDRGVGAFQGKSGPLKPTTTGDLAGDVVDATGEGLETAGETASRVGATVARVGTGIAEGLGEAAADAVPVLGEIVGLGTLIAGIVKAHKHEENSPGPQLTKANPEATEQSGGFEGSMLKGGSGAPGIV